MGAPPRYIKLDPRYDDDALLQNLPHDEQELQNYRATLQRIAALNQGFVFPEARPLAGDFVAKESLPYAQIQPREVVQQQPRIEIPGLSEADRAAADASFEATKRARKAREIYMTLSERNAKPEQPL